MRSIIRTAVLTTAVAAFTVTAPALGSAAAADEVVYAFGVDGTSVTNTITNTTGGVLTCTTSLAPAPGGVLPPIWESPAPVRRCTPRARSSPGPPRRPSPKYRMAPMWRWQPASTPTTP